MSKQVSDERKVAYYIGAGLSIIGLLLFASTFVTFAMHFGDFSNFEAHAKSGMFRAFSGIVLLMVGGVICRVAKQGMAGSGVILDPEKARQDLEPYSRMAGGMLKDALEESEVKLGGTVEKVVMIKCQACGTLNDEHANYCQQCGKPL